MTKVKYTLEAVTPVRALQSGEFPHVVASGNGFFVAGDLGGAAPDGSQDQVYGRLFDSHAAAKTSQFLISTGGTGIDEVGATVLKNGTIVTAYDRTVPGDRDTIFMTLTSPTGTAIRSGFEIPFDNKDQTYPGLSAMADGSYVVTWSFHYSSSDFDIKGQRFDLNGNPIGAVFIVDQTSDIRTGESSTAGLKGGGFVTAFYQKPLATSDYDMAFVIRNAAGVASAKVVSDTSGTDNEYPRVTGLKDGGFALVYQSDGWNKATSDDDITLQIFNADGSPRTNHLRVNSTNLIADGGDTLDDQDHPSVTQLKNGALVVGWRTDAPAGDYDNKVRAFDAKGHALTGITSLPNTAESDYQPTLAGLKNGHVVVTWDRYVGATDTMVGTILDLVRTSIGNKHDNKIEGDGLSDHILGRGGDDQLYGGKGGDKLNGGAGADTLYAGKGDIRDIFVFDKGDSGTHSSTEDRIYGFDAHAKHEDAWDKIDLAHLDVKWKDIHMDTSGKDVEVKIDYKGSGSTDMVIQVIKVDELHRADFIL